jgi:hypothetical protein
MIMIHEQRLTAVGLLQLRSHLPEQGKVLHIKTLLPAWAV